MRWDEVRAAFPDRWVVMEAFEAHSDGQLRIFDRVEVVDSFADGRATMQCCAELDRQYPKREFCFGHTSNAELAVEVRWGVGFRGIRAVDTSR